MESGYPRQQDRVPADPVSRRNVRVGDGAFKAGKVEKAPLDGYPRGVRVLEGLGRADVAGSRGVDVVHQNRHTGAGATDGDAAGRSRFDGFAERCTPPQGEVLGLASAGNQDRPRGAGHSGHILVVGGPAGGDNQRCHRVEFRAKAAKILSVVVEGKASENQQIAATGFAAEPGQGLVGHAAAAGQKDAAGRAWRRRVSRAEPRVVVAGPGVDGRTSGPGIGPDGQQADPKAKAERHQESSSVLNAASVMPRGRQPMRDGISGILPAPGAARGESRALGAPGASKLLSEDLICGADWRRWRHWRY